LRFLAIFADCLTFHYVHSASVA